MTNKKETNSYVDDLVKAKSSLMEMIEDPYSRQNYAWSQCNSTHYLQKKARVNLADKSAEMNSAIEEQEADNAGDTKGVDDIRIDRKEQAYMYALANAQEMLYQHNSDLKVFKSIAGTEWVAPKSNPQDKKTATSRHFGGKTNVADLKSMADALIKGVIAQ